jgi:ubiquinone/menaquinone biosynthesis C-methylase UbiE
MKNKGDNEPFYRSVYKTVLARLHAGESVDNIYDERGMNISKNLEVLVNEKTFRKTLDLGCGLGQVAVSLSAKSREVIAADISEDALEIVREVIKRKKISNMHPILLDATHLPFRDNTFDLVICSGVLEWVATGKDPKIPTEEIQLNMLKEIWRVLTRNGIFWLGIENRYAYGYFLGCIDHHSGLRFITLLPRFIANMYSKLLKRRPYRNYLYTYWELKKILRKAGFATINFYAPFPYYSNPKLLIQLSRYNRRIKKIIGFLRIHSSLSMSILRTILSLHLAKLFFPSFIVLCRK